MPSAFPHGGLPGLGGTLVEVRRLLDGFADERHRCRPRVWLFTRKDLWIRGDLGEGLRVIQLVEDRIAVHHHFEIASAALLNADLSVVVLPKQLGIGLGVCLVLSWAAVVDRYLDSSALRAHFCEVRSD